MAPRYTLHSPRRSKGQRLDGRHQSASQSSYISAHDVNLYTVLSQQSLTVTSKQQRSALCLEELWFSGERTNPWRVSPIRSSPRVWGCPLGDVDGPWGVPLQRRDFVATEPPGHHAAVASLSVSLERCSLRSRWAGCHQRGPYGSQDTW